MQNNQFQRREILKPNWYNSSFADSTDDQYVICHIDYRAVDPSPYQQEEGHYELIPHSPTEFEDFYSHSLDDESNLYDDYDNQYAPEYPEEFVSEEYEAPSELFEHDPFHWEPSTEQYVEQFLDQSWESHPQPEF